MSALHLAPADDPTPTDPDDERLDRVFRALSDRTRRALMSRLAEGEATVSQLAEPFDMSLPAVAKHLRVLEDAGLVRSHKEGRVRRCLFDGMPLQDARQWLDAHRAFWEDSLDALAAYVETP